MFVVEALGRAPDSWWVTKELPRLWQKNKWANTHKKVYYRLTLDGIQLLGNSHMQWVAVARFGCGARSGQGELQDTP